METTAPASILQCISSIYEESKDSKLSDAVLEKTDHQLQQLAAYFGVSKKQAFLIAHIFIFNYKGNVMDVSDLGNYLGCTAGKILHLYPDFNTLVQMGILSKKTHPFKEKLLLNDVFVLDKRIGMAIIYNQPLPDVRPENYTYVVSILEKIYSTGRERMEDNITSEELKEEVKRILTMNKHFPLVQKVLQMELQGMDRYLFLYLCWKTINGQESIDLNRTTEVLFDQVGERMIYLQKFLSMENNLLTQGWVEMVEAGYLNDAEIKLSEQAMALLKSQNIKFHFVPGNKRDVIEPQCISEKNLYYGSQEQKQITVIQKLLMDDNLVKLQQKMMERSLSHGVSVLLYGAPGTGKTEIVLQLARQSNRRIMHVDISNAKSMWFGESEKTIKRIFTDYQALRKQCERCPVLLFNEADAIISNRRETSGSNTGQTENAMQNIILEEMEKFNGLFFATTNLACNFDKAFERRFLFKVEFLKPDVVVRTAIWMSKLKFVTPEECQQLAAHYDFSGGEIDNIVRKCEMMELLNDVAPQMHDVMQFCSEETMVRHNRNKVGFA